jgi:hypothetical protein
MLDASFGPVALMENCLEELRYEVDGTGTSARPFYGPKRPSR